MVFCLLVTFWCVCLFVCLCVVVFVCFCVCLFASLHVCLFACLFVCWFVGLLVCWFVCVCMRLHACVCVRTRVCVRVFAFVLLFACVCVSGGWGFATGGLLLMSYTGQPLPSTIPVGTLSGFVPSTSWPPDSFFRRMRSELHCRPICSALYRPALHCSVLGAHDVLFRAVIRTKPDPISHLILHHLFLPVWGTKR